jgi:hypothetical protein
LKEHNVNAKKYWLDYCQGVKKRYFEV